MFENKNHTPLSEYGEFKLIEHLTKSFVINQKSSLKGVGDDGAVLKLDDGLTVLSTDLLVEGIHFDLSYMPLKHLGYKAVVVNLSDIYAMNAIANQITVSIAVSNRFNLDSLEKLYSGISLACKKFKVDLVGGDTCSSVQGLSISITALGQVSKEKITYRSGANPDDILMVSGDLGGAYMGLQVLEREKAVFQVNPKSQPDLSKYSYCVERQLKPEGRKDVIEILDGLGIIPTSMIDISDGLSSEILHLSKASKLGCTIYEGKIPIDQEVINTAEEFRFNSITAALNGGEDYEILFTIRQEDYEKIKSNNLVSAIGHMTKKNLDCYMENNLDRKIKLVAQGWKNFKNLS